MSKKLESLGYEQVGIIGVDAGLCWIGDPCYVFHKEDNPKAIGNNWGEFCDKLRLDPRKLMRAVQFNYDRGHEGLGVCVSTGWGDGTYPVYIKCNVQGQVTEVKVVFIDEDEDEEEDI